MLKSQHDYVATLPAQLTRLPREQWPNAGRGPERLAEVWISRNYLVQIFNEPGDIARLSINRSKTNGQRWEDGLTWDELQAIKAEVGFARQCAVEVYPPDDDVVNVANMRHLWVLPEPPAFMWEKSK